MNDRTFGRRPLIARLQVSPRLRRSPTLKWFELFHDDRLTEVVSLALKQNFDVRIAAERVLQARAAYGITRADQFPAVDVSGGRHRCPHFGGRRESWHSSGRRHERELHTGGLQPGMGARRMGTAATVERGRARGVPGDRRSASGRGHDARRRCRRTDTWRCARSISSSR